MATLEVTIDSLDETLARAAEAWKAAEAGGEPTTASTLSFSSWDNLHRVLSPKRLEIVRAMTGQAPLSIREVARRVGRDFKSVHGDVDMLWRNGVIDKAERGVVFPYDRIHINFEIDAAA
jgi:predicted transcriptional regulator